MSEDRNFRYFYYEKVGFRGVEEKKSLDILLAERPADLLSKLSSFTHRFQIPGIYRKQIWKLLLDVINANPDQFIADEQCLHCNDIIRALQIMLYIDDNTCPSKQLVLMFFLEFSELNINIDKQFQKIEVKDLLVISDVFVKEFIDGNNKMDTNIEDTYWLFRNLISNVRNNFSALIETYEKFINGLALEDRSLHCHLVSNGVIKAQTNAASAVGIKKDYRKYNLLTYRPLITWFIRFYAGVVDHHSLIRIYDRVIGALIHGTRPFAVLPSVGKAILLHFRKELLDLNTCEDITKRLLSPLTVEQSEQVITKAFAL